MNDLKNVVEEAKRTVKCHVCGSTKWKTLFIGYDRNLATTEERFSVIQCLECGLGQTVPLISVYDFGKYYPDHYYQIKPYPHNFFRKFVRQVGDERLRRHEQAKVRGLKKFKHEGRVLDIGCGMGHFLVEARKAGYETVGIEFSQRASDYARNDYQLNVITGDFLSHSFGDEQFDIITLWHVLEHFHEPWTILEKIFSLLAPQGVLVISLPNFSSFQARLFGHRWYHLDLPRHLYHYSPHTLGKLIERIGFKVLWINHKCLEYNRNGYLGSIVRFNDLNENVLTKIFRKTIGYYLSGVPARIESVLKSGGTFELYAQKT